MLRVVLALLITVAVVVILVVVAFVRARNEILAQRQELSIVAQTSRGPVEYAELGRGQPVLYVHGTPGGYDQLYLMLRAEYGDRGPAFRAIVPSRPGYLRTPLSAGRTFAEQADTMAALLDSLQIDRAALVAVSGGGPSALQFAIRHPRRCSALILESAVTQQLTLEVPWLIRQLPRDFLTWSVQYLFKSRFDALAKADPVVGPMWSELIRGGFPFSEREAGRDNDFEQIRRMPALPLREITCPTLVMHGTADINVPFSHAELATSEIAGSELLRFEGEDHFAGLSKRRQWKNRMHAFLAEHANDPPSESGGLTRVAPDGR